MHRIPVNPTEALKKADDFIALNKQAHALKTLQDVLRKLGWKNNYSETIVEPVMLKYLELCVELKQLHIAKMGLHNYRRLFQNVNAHSLERVIRSYLRMAEGRTEFAQAMSMEAVLELNDLECIATPESIMLSAVTSENAQYRIDHTILLPSLRFLWDVYFQCLELLRISTQCEALYHYIARIAFEFCKKYNRKREFRRLCDTLRRHLEEIRQHSGQPNRVSIANPETSQLCLETRLVQLDTAMAMELWQEAYKSILDIRGLMTLLKKAPHAKDMANYYQKLAIVFAKAGDLLYHAAALMKVFQLTREHKKNLSTEELQRKATEVLLAVLSIPLPSAHPEYDRFAEVDFDLPRSLQKVALLDLLQPPTRASLVHEMIRLAVPDLVVVDFRDMYNWLEVEFNPLNLCTRIRHIIERIEDENVEHSHLLPYVQPLKELTAVRLIQELSQIYESITFERLRKLASFCDHFELERLLAACVRYYNIQLSIDHRNQCVYFGTDYNVSQPSCHLDGPVLQSTQSAQFLTQLISMDSVLTRVISIVYPDIENPRNAALCKEIIKYYFKNREGEFQRRLERQQIIEERKALILKFDSARVADEARRTEEEARKIKEAEEKRLIEAQAELDRKRHESEIKAIKEKNLQEKIQKISQTLHGKKLLAKLDEEAIKKLDAGQIAAREVEDLQRARQELQAKLKAQEKKINYFERAKHLEELPLLEQFLTEKRVKDTELVNEQEKARIEKAIADHAVAITQRNRMQRMHEDRDVFSNYLQQRHGNLYAEKLAKFEADLTEERQERLTARVVGRREERRRKWLREKEEQRIRKAEELICLKEEEARQAAEAHRLEREAEDEKRRVQYDKQRAREVQADRRIQEERERKGRELDAESAEASSKSSGVWRRPAAVDRSNRTALAAAGNASYRYSQRTVSDSQLQQRREESKWRRADNLENESPARLRQGLDGESNQRSGSDGRHRDRDLQRGGPICREKRAYSTNWRDDTRPADRAARSATRRPSGNCR